MVENYLKEYGYKKTEIDKILNNKNIKNINIKKVKEINKFLEKMNIPKDKIISIIIIIVINKNLTNLLPFIFKLYKNIKSTLSNF